MVDDQGTAGKPTQHTKEIAPAGQAEEAQTTVDSKLESVISVVNTSELSKQYQCLTRINMVFFWMLSWLHAIQNTLEDNIVWSLRTTYHFRFFAVLWWVMSGFWSIRQRSWHQRSSSKSIPARLHNILLSLKHIPWTWHPYDWLLLPRGIKRQEEESSKCLKLIRMPFSVNSLPWVNCSVQPCPPWWRSHSSGTVAYKVATFWMRQAMWCPPSIRRIGSLIPCQHRNKHLNFPSWSWRMEVIRRPIWLESLYVIVWIAGVRAPMKISSVGWMNEVRVFWPKNLQELRQLCLKML